MKAVLDANIIVSAVIKPEGKPAQILGQRDRFELLISDHILQEAQRVLHRKHIQEKYHPSEDKIEGILNVLREFGTLITVEHTENLIPKDPPDNIVLACAAEGSADYLVSGNQHLLDLKQHRGVKIVTTTHFLEIINQKSKIINEAQ